MQKWCKACVLLDGLNRGLPRQGIGRARGANLSKDREQIRSGSEMKGSVSQSKPCGTLDF